MRLQNFDSDLSHIHLRKQNIKDHRLCGFSWSLLTKQWKLPESAMQGCTGCVRWVSDIRSLVALGMWHSLKESRVTDAKAPWILTVNPAQDINITQCWSKWRWVWTTKSWGKLSWGPWIGEVTWQQALVGSHRHKRRILGHPVGVEIYRSGHRDTECRSRRVYEVSFKTWGSGNWDEAEEKGRSHQREGSNQNYSC